VRAKTTRSSGEDTLFSNAAKQEPGAVPLAERMRPRTLADYMGQRHVVGPGKLLERAIANDKPPSMILWGPPGVGKTSLGRVLAEQTKARFVPFSAVLGSLPELREHLQAAKDARAFQGQRTILFVDEIHRFNKSQQDAFLPHVENGTILLVGATTENPSFAVNAALLSRCKVFRLEALSEADIVALLRRALSDVTLGLGKTGVRASEEVLQHLSKQARGDARRALTDLEATVAFVLSQERAPELAEDAAPEITLQTFEAIGDTRTLLFDKSGDEHHAVTSAFIKSMRGSDPDAAVYWMMRLVEAGDDPLFILRRMIIFASEDVGNADARALMVATAADEAFRRLGMPEGLYAMGQAVTYLASAPKSNAANIAWHRARDLVREHGALPVPKKLRPGSTALNRSMGYGADYKYAHDYEDGVVPGESYMPEALVNERLYEPVPRGEETRIKERLELIRAKAAKANDV
jgi:putative ATPase